MVSNPLDADLMIASERLGEAASLPAGAILPLCIRPTACLGLSEARSAGRELEPPT